MKFSVGDKVVHPHHGPGRIVLVERKELMDGTKRYYVIDIPGQGLIVQVPVRRAKEVGMRRAMPQSRLLKVWTTLRGRPQRLPEDYKERQEEVWTKLKTGQVMQLAAVVRDLAWHRERLHLTRKDTEYLKMGQGLLAAEMALVSEDDVSDVRNQIESAVADSMANRVH
jgi:CarD family transcriptional regulator